MLVACFFFVFVQFFLLLFDFFDTTVFHAFVSLHAHGHYRSDHASHGDESRTAHRVKEDVVECFADVESALVDIGANARNGAMVGELPECVFDSVDKSGFGVGILGDEELVSVAEFLAEVSIEEMRAGVDDRSHTVVFFEQVGKKFHAVAYLFGSPMSFHLDVDERSEVLLVNAAVSREIFHLVANGRGGAHEMIASYFHSGVARPTNIVLECGRYIGSPFGGLDVDELNIFVGSHFVPVDVALMIGNIDTVVGGGVVAIGLSIEQAGRQRKDDQKDEA